MAERKLPEGWEEKTTTTGIKYWFAPATKKRTFLRPTTAEKTQTQQTSAATTTLKTLCERLVITTPQHVEELSSPGEVADGVIKTMLDERLVHGNPEAIKRAFSRVGNNLREFTLPPASVAGRLAKEFVNGVSDFTRNLVSLSLRGCSAVNPSVLANISRNNGHSLVHLDIGECSALDSQGISESLLLCSQLKAFSCDHCVGAKLPLKLSNTSLESIRLSGLIVKSIIFDCANVLSLDCSDCWDVETCVWEKDCEKTQLVEMNFFRCKKLQPASFATFINQTSTPNIRYLNICECKLLDGVSVASAVSGLSNLTHIVASKCEKIDKIAITELSRSCPRLASAFLNDDPAISDEACMELSHCNSLEGITFPESISDNSLSAIASSSRMSLAVADLTSSTILTNAGIAALLRSCLNLRTLAISDCPNLTDECFAPLTEPNTRYGSHLKNLTAMGVPLTDLALSSLAGRCHALVSVDFLHNTHITDNGIRGLIENCPLLSSVNLSFCTLITDSSLFSFSEAQVSQDALPLSLDIYGCAQITVNGVLTLLASSHHVKDINVSMNISQQLQVMPLNILHGAQIHSSRGDPIFP